MSPTTTSALVRHPTWSQSYRQRASLPDTPPLTAYLLRLIALKRTNLCLSADVTTTSELLSLADEVGDSICILKTHCDIISDFGERTVRGLRSIARRRRFIIFEDRKFADIGETVKKQYLSGPFRIARWAEITNAHILPGPAIITGLREAAEMAIAAFHAAVHTEISASPATVTGQEESDEEELVSPSNPNGKVTFLGRTGSNTWWDADRLDAVAAAATPAERKLSIVSISTTISTRTENISPLPTPDFDLETSDDPLARLGDPPIRRALLLLAEMSSKGHLLTGAYTAQCAALARQNKDFVMGFIAQHSLNSEPGDNFVTMTPGCQLPPTASDTSSSSTFSVVLGDGLGQQYNTPRKIIFEQGCDVVIVGRGIVNADERHLEAERYRREAWDAYEERIATYGA